MSCAAGKCSCSVLFLFSFECLVSWLVVSSSEVMSARGIERLRQQSKCGKGEKQNLYSPTGPRSRRHNLMSRMVVRDETMSTGKVASIIRIPPSTLKDEDRDQKHFSFSIEIIFK